MKERQAAVRSTDKASASSLGRLNAAHASTQALANASPNSTVGRIGSYKAALEDGDLDAAAEALAGVANKAVTEDSIRSLNGLLGVTIEDKKITEIVDKIETLQEKQTVTTETTVATTTTAAAATDQTTSTPSSMGRLNAAHASPRAMERASLNSPVGQIGAYKTAVSADELDAAAAALAKASNKPVTAETVRNLNGLLGVTLTEDDVTEIVEKTETLKAEDNAKTSSKKTSGITR